MNWNEFLMGVTGTYILYYSANFAWDIFRGQRPGRGDPDEDLLFIANASEPTIVELSQADPVEPEPERLAEEFDTLPSPAVQAPAGVDLEELFSLYHAGMIEQTRSITY